MSALMVVAAALVLAVLAFVVLALAGSRPSIVADAAALARVKLPVTQGKIESVEVTAPGGRRVPVAVHGGRLWPLVALSPGERLSVEVVLHHPGWIAWLAGSRYTERLQMRTPSSPVRERYVTLAAGAPLRLAFAQPVSRLVYGPPEHLEHRTLTHPSSQVTLPREGEAG